MYFIVALYFTNIESLISVYKTLVGRVMQAYGCQIREFWAITFVKANGHVDMRVYWLSDIVEMYNFHPSFRPEPLPHNACEIFEMIIPSLTFV